MIYPDVKLDEWIQHYDLEIEVYKCSKCGKHYAIDIPIITKDSAGLQSKIHRCGKNYYSTVLTPRTTEALEFWSSII